MTPNVHLVCIASGGKLYVISKLSSFYLEDDARIMSLNGKVSLFYSLLVLGRSIDVHYRASIGLT